MECWLLNDSFYPVDGIKYISDSRRMEKVALQFLNASWGVLNGCIGALDSWVVKIQKPMKSDGVINSQSFYSR